MTVLDDIEGYLFGEETEAKANPQRQKFSTGPKPIEVGEKWERFAFGFTARSLSIRGDAEILVSFQKPHQNLSEQFGLSTEELPFSVGGEMPVGETQVWVRARSGTATIEILAM